MGTLISTAVRAKGVKTTVGEPHAHRSKGDNGVRCQICAHLIFTS